MKRVRLLCIFLTALMVLSLSACGKGKATDSDSKSLKIGKYQLLRKDACIMEDIEGNDAVVLTMDFTNNSKDSSAYFLSITETARQDGMELEPAVIFTDADSLETLLDTQFLDVAPGETLEICSAFVLADSTSEIEISFEELFGGKSGKFTIDPSTLSRESAGNETELAAGGDELAAGENELIEWWNGDWYGWWSMTALWGDSGALDDGWWDICATIDIGEDYMGTITLWDEDFPKSDPLGIVSISLNETGIGEYGTVMSEGGTFMDAAMEHADWIVDPDLADYENMIRIDGSYAQGNDEFYYEIYLRPWGSSWDDVEPQDLPYYYDDWYLPLIEAGMDMPDSIGADAQ